MAVLTVTQREETQDCGLRYVTGLLSATSGSPTRDEFVTGLSFVESCLVQCHNAAGSGEVDKNTDSTPATANGKVSFVSDGVGRTYRFLATGI